MRKQSVEARGHLILIGVRGSSISDTVKGKANAILGLSLLIVFFVAIGAIISPFLSSISGITTDRFWSLVFFWVFVLLSIAILGYHANTVGLEVDGIYEKGVSNVRATLVESRRGEGFVPYESITSIKLESRDTTEGVVDVLTIYSSEPPAPAMRPFSNYGYRNDFWNRLIQTLQTHCQGAKWLDKTSSAT